MDTMKTPYASIAQPGDAHPVEARLEGNPAIQQVEAPTAAPSERGAGNDETGSSFVLRAEAIMTELQDGTAVVLNLKTKFYYTLNKTALVVWKCIGNGRGTASETVERLVEEFDVEESVARRDVGHVVQELLSEGLLGAR